jgi:hypothetical protein
MLEVLELEDMVEMAVQPVLAEQKAITDRTADS